MIVTDEGQEWDAKGKQYSRKIEMVKTRILTARKCLSFLSTAFGGGFLGNYFASAREGIIADHSLNIEQGIPSVSGTME